MISLTSRNLLTSVINQLNYQASTDQKIQNRAFKRFTVIQGKVFFLILGFKQHTPYLDMPDSRLWSQEKTFPVFSLSSPVRILYISIKIPPIFLNYREYRSETEAKTVHSTQGAVVPNPAQLLLDLLTLIFKSLRLKANTIYGFQNCQTNCMVLGVGY